MVLEADVAAIRERVRRARAMKKQPHAQSYDTRQTAGQSAAPSLVRMREPVGNPKRVERLPGSYLGIDETSSLAKRGGIKMKEPVGSPPKVVRVPGPSISMEQLSTFRNTKGGATRMHEPILDL